MQTTTESHSFNLPGGMVTVILTIDLRSKNIDSEKTEIKFCLQHHIFSVVGHTEDALVVELVGKVVKLIVSKIDKLRETRKSMCKLLNRYRIALQLFCANSRLSKLSGAGTITDTEYDSISASLTEKIDKYASTTARPIDVPDISPARLQAEFREIRIENLKKEIKAEIRAKKIAKLEAEIRAKKIAKLEAEIRARKIAKLKDEIANRKA